MRVTRAILILLFFLCITTPAKALDVTVKVSSFKVDITMPYMPENLLDGDLSTAWVGGGIGPGVGQWIELQFGVPVRVDKLGLFNGHQAEGRFEEFRRIRSGRIVYPDGTEVRFWLRDEAGEQIVDCPAVPVKSIRIVVDSVFPKGDYTSKTKLAVSEIKLYLALMADPGATPREESGPSLVPAMPPADPDMEVPEEAMELLRTFYVRHTTLADDFAELFAEDVRDRNDFRFEVFKEIQRQRGTYDLLRSAQVDTSGLGFELVEREGGFARVRVFGAYHVKAARVDTNLEEDSTFVLSKEHEGWKIIELEGEEDLF